MHDFDNNELQLDILSPPNKLPALLDSKTLPPNAVILITGSTPGAGSTSLAQQIANSLKARCIIVGQEVRKGLGVSTEEEMVYRPEEVEMIYRNGLDEQIYRDLPQGSQVVVEGKRAMADGPNFLGERPIVRIVFYTDPVTAAIRISRREQKNVLDILVHPHLLVEYIRKVKDRIAFHEKALAVTIPTTRTDPDIVYVDTGERSVVEIVDQLRGKGDSIRDELQELQKYYAGLHLLVVGMLSSSELKLDPREIEHINENLNKIRYQLTERLPVIADPAILPLVRTALKNAFVNVLYPIFRMLPKFYIDSQGVLSADTNSHSWSPEYYKLARSWPLLKYYLSGKKILDPFAGSGTMLTYLTAREIPASVTFGDICYIGGRQLENHAGIAQLNYYPKYNVYLYRAMLDQLPSAYRPDCMKLITGFVTMDADKPPFPSETFDLVCGDPPYGKNLHEGNFELFLSFLPGLLRVSREGGLFLVPSSWVSDLQKRSDIIVSQLTEDLSLGASRLPTCFIRVRSSA